MWKRFHTSVDFLILETLNSRILQPSSFQGYYANCNNKMDSIKSFWSLKRVNELCKSSTSFLKFGNQKYRTENFLFISNKKIFDRFSLWSTREVYKPFTLTQLYTFIERWDSSDHLVQCLSFFSFFKSAFFKRKQAEKHNVYKWNS